MPGRLRAAAVAAAMMSACAAHAQYSASIDFASKNRYRGTDLGDSGAVIRTGVSADAVEGILGGAYAGVSGAWSTRGGHLETAEALVGWSRRFNTLSALSSVDSRWGWDTGIHLLRYAGNSRYDFHELMVGLLAPGWSARVWWSPNYFGGSHASVYGEVDRSIDLPDRWRVFGHVGLLRYGDGGSAAHSEIRLDGLLGAGHTAGAWDLRIMRDGRLSLGGRDQMDMRRSASAWVFSAGVAF